MRPNFIPEELTLLDSSPSNSHYAETFVYAPANSQEQPLGNLYIVISVSSNKSRKENAEKASDLANTVKSEYYKNTITTPLSSLRFTLKKTNSILSEPENDPDVLDGASKTKKTAVKISDRAADFINVKMLIAAVKHNTLHLARLGEMAALVLRNGALQPVFTAVKSPSAPERFENIASGEIFGDDCLILATNHIHKISGSDIIAGLKFGDLAQKITGGKKKIEPASGLLGLSMIALRPSPAEKTSRAALRLESRVFSATAPNNENLTANANLASSPSKSSDKEETTPEQDGLNVRFKLILFAAAVAVILGLTIFVAIKLKRETALKRKEAETLVNEISGTRDKIQPLIEINNEKEAGELLNEAQNKLKRLEELGYFKTTRATLSEDLGKMAKSLQRLEEIKNVRLMVDLENNSANFEPRDMALGKNKIILFGKETFYTFDLNRATGSFNVLNNDYQITSVVEAPNNPNKIILLSGNKVLLRTESEDKEIWTAGNQDNLVKFSEYGGAIYILSEAGSISKLTLPDSLTKPAADYGSSTEPTDIGAPTGSVGAASLWLNSSVKIEPPLFDIVVEGSIFGINKDNIVYELANGKKKNQIKIFEPVTKIFTLSSLKNVYLLSPENGLIIVMDKTGTIKKRFSHSELSGAKSFFVNSQERAIYFLKGKKVFSFEI